MRLVVQPIIDGADAPGNPVSAPGEQQLDLRMGENGFFAGVRRSFSPSHNGGTQCRSSALRW